MRSGQLLLLAAICVGLAGCVSGGPRPTAEVLPAPQAVVLENPLFLAQGPEGYPQVFSNVYKAVNYYFPIARSNIYAGTIESEPVVTAGFWDAARYDFYSFRQFFEASLQTERRIVLITITPATSGGYFVDLQVLKELEDNNRPRAVNAGGSTYRYEAPFEKVYDVVDLPTISRGWIPLGRDHEMEQLILMRVRECRP